MRALGLLPTIGRDRIRRGKRVGVSAQAAGAVIKATHLRSLGHVWAVHGRVEASEVVGRPQLVVPFVLADRACKREAAELAPVIAALEWRFECKARSALARLADAFSSGDTLHQPGLDGDASGPQDAWTGCAASTVPRAWGWAAGRRPVPGRGRRRPHVRWRARRESIYIRCSLSTLLQQCGRGMLDVRMVTPRPGG